MSHNPSLPDPVDPVAATPVSDPRNALMHAFAVAENVVARLADRPATVTLVDNFRGGYGVELYFHREPEQVARFAAEHGVEVLVNPDRGGDSSTYTSADVRVDDVDVRAWSLMTAEAVAA